MLFLAAWYDWPGAGQGIPLPSPGATWMPQACREHHVGRIVKFETWSEDDVVLVCLLYGRELGFFLQSPSVL